MSIIIDSNIYIAYFNKRDSMHLNAIQLLKKATGGEYGDIKTSDYIFDESVTFTLGKSGPRTAQELGKMILETADMLQVDEQIFSLAWKIFGKGTLSFTDCTTIALMEKYSIKYVMTFDREFRSRVMTIGV